MQRFLRHHHETRAAIEFGDECLDAIAGETFDASFGKNAGGDFAVAPRWREDECPFGAWLVHARPTFSGAFSPIHSGTPRSTPWKLVSGSPSVMPSDPI